MIREEQHRPDDQHHGIDLQVLADRKETGRKMDRVDPGEDVVADEKGEGHAVLLVRTKSGDYILDNKRDDVLLWYEVKQKFNYTMYTRQSPIDPKLWHDVKNQ